MDGRVCMQATYASTGSSDTRVMKFGLEDEGAIMSFAALALQLLRQADRMQAIRNFLS